jgi:hypothetical protein
MPPIVVLARVLNACARRGPPVGGYQIARRGVDRPRSGAAFVHAPAYGTCWRECYVSRRRDSLRGSKLEGSQMLKAFALASLLLGAGTSGFAQQDTTASRYRPADEWGVRAKLHVGTPQRVSFAPGIMKIVRNARDGTSSEGPTVDAEIGTSAGKLRVGYARVAYGPGYAVQAAAMRVWGQSSWSEPSRNYIGGELHLTVFVLDLGIGLYASATRTPRARFAASAGIGL